MTQTPKSPEKFDDADQQLVLATLERDQLSEAKKQHLPRRRLKGFQVFVLWALRLYLLFMMAVVLYQICTGAH
jgi:hypothetical protein